MLRRILMGLVLTLGLWVPAFAGEGESEFLLSIDGPPATLYTGSCRLTDGRGLVSVLPVSGAPPFSRTLIGHSLDCRLRQDSAKGFLTFEVRRGANVSRSRTQGAGSSIAFSLQ